MNIIRSRTALEIQLATLSFPKTDDAELQTSLNLQSYRREE